MDVEDVDAVLVFNLDRLVDAEHGTWDTQNGGIDTTAVQQLSGVTGLDGYGSGSYSDAVILRDRDANATGGWAAEADGMLEKRREVQSLHCTR